MPDIETSIEKFSPSKTNKPGLHTLFYQGITCSQVYLSNYFTREFETTTGEFVISEGRNNLKPINVLINPYIGCEIKDVNTKPFTSIRSYLNPIKIASYSMSTIANWYHGIRVYNKYEQDSVYMSPNSVKAHTLNFSEISIGQETDMESHRAKYEHWKIEHPNCNFIAYGVSRGAATTFNACAKYKYPELKLVILEACFYSLKDCFHLNRYHTLQSAFTTGLSLFTKYHNDGPSPGKSIADFPENVPVVLITSEKDFTVPPESTIRLANELAAKKKNDVYLLVLKNSSHPNYIYDDANDRDKYQCFLHAIYQKYNLTNNDIYNPKLAEKGKVLLEECLIKPYNNGYLNYTMG